MELYELTVQQLIKELRTKNTNAREIMTAVIDRINAVDGKVKAFLTLNLTEAMEKAEEFDRLPGAGAIAGIPFAVKDDYCTKGIRTTCASKMLENFVPSYNAAAVERLYAAGGILAGKLNLDEFAMGCSTETSAFYPTRNPWDLERVPGGSSGGSAAAVAAEEIPFALASDTGGSTRQPASYCGVVGLKPTYGRVSRWGMVAHASSLDQAGIISKNVFDAGLMLELIAGHDPLDSTSVKTEAPAYTADMIADIKGLKIGYPREYLQQADEEVRIAVQKALLEYEGLGAIIEEVSLSHSEYALPAYHIIGSAEASSNMGKFDGIRYGLQDISAENVADLISHSRQRGFGPEVKRRIILGTYALSSGKYEAYYLKALKVRRLIKDDFTQIFDKFDVIITPTTPSTAYKIGENAGDILTSYQSDVFTVSANLAGLPAISIPCGLADGLPVGLQIIAKPFAEEILLNAAYAFEQATDHHRIKPDLGGGIN